LTNDETTELREVRRRLMGNEEKNENTIFFAGYRAVKGEDRFNSGD
jgi:hypothetical protein